MSLKLQMTRWVGQMPRRPQDKEEAEQIAAALSRTLRALRHDQGWSQEFTSERLEMSTEAYGRLERGKSLPSFPTFMRICEVFDITPDILLGYDSTPRQPLSEEEQLRQRLSIQLQALDDETLKSLEPLMRHLWRQCRH